ncbi:oxalurate catabolism protein HpxZ [Devosia sp. SL43]|uniref:oxalurate catabolism protein HpxZ n=1 Tax=Devosia sp. SL43 TaxID=2806348 RepID=UPI001F47CBB1|nr:oxalurate catabolism protein HpxZ [Devosia sp. SL43]UJW85358.1 oxalurate catabolism protein HpxZ [Devosia sp. SL43]
MILNDPAVVAEVRDAFERYERALLANDAAVLDAMFVQRADTVRYGVAELQYGIDEIRAFRAMQRPFTRTLDRLTIVTYGSDVATASTLFYREDFPGQVGRQQQTWLRTDAGWCVAAAHVSMMPRP